MTKILITGFSGFVSRFFVRHLEESAIAADVLGVSRTPPDFPLDGYRHVRCGHRRLDLLDRASVREVLQSFKPDFILHLAAYSSVGFSWAQPVESFANNTNIFLHLLEEVRELRGTCRILSVGSSEEYGNVAAHELPLVEDRQLRPLSPYAVARVSQELLSRVYVRGYGLDIVMTRSFNHIGPFQKPVFVVPSLARQLTAIRNGRAPARLVTGDRSIVRDFVDVRDVVRAYYELLLHGHRGEVYNVCSGQGISIQGVIDTMQELLGIECTLETDPALVRPNDNAVIVGSCEKIRCEHGWHPRVSLRASLAEILAYWAEH